MQLVPLLAIVAFVAGIAIAPGALGQQASMRGDGKQRHVLH